MKAALTGKKGTASGPLTIHASTAIGLGQDCRERVRLRLLAGRRVELLSYALVLLVVATVVVTAVRQNGYPRHRADLNDGVIWVSNNDLGKFGRLNKPTGQLDGATAVGAEVGHQYDLLQEGAAVLGIDQSSATVHGIDVATGSGQEASAAVPAGASMAMAGGTLAVVDPGTGKVWATDASPELGFPTLSDVDATSKPLATAGKEAAGTVTAGGSVVAASAAADEVVTIARTESGFAKPRTTGLDLDGAPALTSVGDVALVLDTADGTLYADGKELADLPADSVLQQVGPAADDVLVATADSLLAVDLASGETSTVVQPAGGGTPAAPVRVGGCQYAAWSSTGSGPGYVSTICPDGVERGGQVGDAEIASHLVLRTNRGQVALNDLVSGAVWNIDDVKPEQVDDWEGFKPQPDDQQDQQDEKTDDPDAAQKAPKAADDTLGARPGTTTVLHVLDNDQAPEGTLLAISAVDGVSEPDAVVRISPDAQSVLLTLPAGVAAGSTVRFGYTVNAGTEKTAQADVTVPVRGSESAQPPTLREGALDTRPAYTVASGGTIAVPVIGDWRDPGEGDPVSLTGATVEAGTVNVTSGGQLRFDPGKPGTQRITYTVTDSAGSSAEDTVDVQVQRPTDLQAVPPTSQPDFARGVVGEPIVVRPLANDVPGSDPLHPHARLRLAGQATPGDAAGLQLSSDLESGRVTVTASRPGSYFIDYSAAYGDAAASPNKIRVDVTVPAGADEPITVPDSVTLFGDSQGVVDVLANDYDPQGRLLVTQDAVVANGLTEPIEVSVVQGRWVRLRATGQISRSPLTLHYRVSNGAVSGVEGDIVVRQAAQVDRDRPVTSEDDAVVRAGSAVAVPVLDNDFTPSGAPVTLDAAGAEGASGVLEVTGGPGSAYVSGRLVRFVAPADVTESVTVEVGYVARHDDLTTPGTARVTIVPAADPEDDQPPTPPTIEARAVAGSTVRLKVPAAGADPDGDPVTVVGLGSAPDQGRVLGFGAASIQYQAFPLSSGTDTFTYQVTDPGGNVGTGTVRVAVVPPGQSQPPVAVADTITAAPGRTVTVPVLNNDYVAQGDTATIGDLAEANGGELPGGARLESDQGPVSVVAGDDPEQPTTTVAYSITNGVGAPSSSTLTVHSVPGYNNPPVVYDAFGTLPESGDRVTIDALARAYDPDGELDQVTVTLDPSVPATVVGGQVTVPLLDHPQVLPYTAVDADGGSATAQLYVPAQRGGPPRLASDEPLELEAGGSLDVDLADLVVDPAGKPVQLTLKNKLVAAPADRIQLTNDGSVLHLEALTDDYVGPASISFEVTNAAEVGGPGETATLNAPVQIGSAEPIFTCPGPEAPLTVVQGGTPITTDVVELCHVWAPDAQTLADLTVSGSTDGADLDGVTVEGNGDHTLTIGAGGDATATQAPQPVTVTVDGSDVSAQVYVVVTPAPPPTFTPVSLDGLLQGETRRVELSPTYFHSVLADAQPSVVETRQTGGQPARIGSSGSAIEITPGADSSGPMTFEVVMSDVSDTSRADRLVTGQVRVTALGKPDRPGRPVTAKGVEDQQATLSWDAPADNGAPITGYDVTWGGGSKSCRTNGCTITGLTNGESYTFTVVATNSVGTSEPSQPSAAVTPDAVPGAVSGLVTVGEPTNHQVQLRWVKPEKQTSLDKYVVSWAGHRQTVAAARTTFAVKTDDNNVAYQVSVLAQNKQGFSDARTIEVQSSGVPAAPAGVTAEVADGADGRAKVSVSWTHSDWQGKPGSYEVLRNGTQVATLPSGTSSWVDPSIAYDGTAYTYGVRAINATGGPQHTSPPGQAPPVKAQGTPDTPTFTRSEATGENRQGAYVFRAGEVRGTGSTYELTTADGTFTGPVERNGQVTVTRPTGENGSSTTPSLKVCNAQKLCSDTARGAAVVPFGPLTDAMISNFQTSTAGTVVSWSAVVDTNGRPATINVSSNGGAARVYDGVDSRSYAISGSMNVGYSQAITITIRLESPGRGTATATKTAPTTDSEPVTISVERGAKVQRNDCTDPSCGYIRVTFTGLTSGGYSCSTFGPGTQGLRTVMPNRNGTYETQFGYYGFPGRTIYVGCTGDRVPGLLVRSNDYTWPSN